jgi:serine O-acetyltransferase
MTANHLSPDPPESRGAPTPPSVPKWVGLRDTFALIREDLGAHKGSWATPGFQALATHRLGRWIPGAPRVLRPPLRLLYRFLYVVVRNVYGIELPWQTWVGRRVRIVHQSGIVIHPQAVIGDRCLVRQNVTLGRGTLGRDHDAPRVGADVTLGSGAVLVGRITVGDRARIGPNAVVMTNVPAGATVVLSPPRMVHPPNPRLSERSEAPVVRTVNSEDGP